MAQEDSCANCEALHRVNQALRKRSREFEDKLKNAQITIAALERTVEKLTGDKRGQ